MTTFPITSGCLGRRFLRRNRTWVALMLGQGTRNLLDDQEVAKEKMNRRNEDANVQWKEPESRGNRLPLARPARWQPVQNDDVDAVGEERFLKVGA